MACVFQQQGVDKLELHIPKHGLAVGKEALVEVVVSVKPLQGMVNISVRIQDYWGMLFIEPLCTKYILSSYVLITVFLYCPER